MRTRLEFTPKILEQGRGARVEHHRDRGKLQRSDKAIPAPLNRAPVNAGPEVGDDTREGGLIFGTERHEGVTLVDDVIGENDLVPPLARTDPSRSGRGPNPGQYRGDEPAATAVVNEVNANEAFGRRTDEVGESRGG